MQNELAQPDDSTGKLPLLAGKYRVQRVLGRGGMGVVYEAENTWTGRRVAVKVLVTADRDPEHVARFLQEARTTASLHHPAIVDVLDMGRDPDTQDLYLVQELLLGETLRARLDRVGRLTPDEAVRVVRAVLEGLVEAHAQGIVHRDIKPSNLMLTAGDPPGVKLIDFGIAKALTRERSSVETSTGQILGTPAYMAPEQLRGERGVDAQADVWAVGAVLYEALSGRNPFRADNYNVLVHSILSGPPTSLRSVAPDVPPGLAAIVDRALEPDRARRYAGASAMLAALGEPWDVAPAPEVAPPPRRPVALAVGVMVGALAAVGVWSSTRTQPGPRPSTRAEPVSVAPTPHDASSPDAALAATPPADADTPPDEAPRNTRRRTHATTQVVRDAAVVTPAARAAPAVRPSDRATLLAPEEHYP